MVLVIILFHVRYERDVRSLYTHIDDRCKLYGTVKDIETGSKEGTYVITLKDVDIKSGTMIKSTEKMLINAGEDTCDFKIGNRILVTGRSVPFAQAGNPGQFDEYSYYRNSDYAYRVISEKISIINTHCSYREYLRKFKEKSIEKIYGYLPGRDAGIACAMVFGEKKLLSEEDKELYKQNGIMHILAVSGLHVSMISMLLLWIISAFPVNYYAGRISVLVLLFIYGIMTGFSISCIRAVIMITIQIFSRIKGKTYDALSAVCTAGIITLLMDHRVLFTCSFLLSYGAVFGIIWADRFMKPLFECPVALEGVRDSLCVSVGVTLYIAPVILYYFYEIPLYSVIINLLVVPLVSLLFILIILCVVCSWLYSGIFSPLAEMLSGGIHAIFSFYDIVLNSIGRVLSGFRITGHISIIQCVVYYIIIIAASLIMIRIKKRGKAGVLVLMLAVTLFIVSYRQKPSGIEVTVLDVGQGDGILIQTPDGHNIMVDGGSTDVKSVGKYRLEPFLKYNGVTHIDYWIVSHIDEDHYSGLAEIIERRRFNNIRINTLIVSEALVCREKANEVLKSDESSMLYVKNGDRLDLGSVSLIFMNPQSNKSYDDQNEASAVFGLKYGSFDMLFTGDIGNEAESDIVGEYDGCCEVLKAPHHGSKNSSSGAFLDKIGCREVIISYGEGNRYGHPAKETIERYNERKMSIYETAKDGAVTVFSDGTSYKTTSFCDTK